MQSSSHVLFTHACFACLLQERCGSALAEMERMKADMMTLASQLQEAEERAISALEDKSGQCPDTLLHGCARHHDHEINIDSGLFSRICG